MKTKNLIRILIVLFSMNLYGINKNDFVLNVVGDNGFVKEIDGQVVVPFDSEYELLLKNNHDRKCTAKIWVDGVLVSNFGDFIIDANSELNLERFVTESMEDGKKFKFVTLDNPEVDDPTRKENGIIKVEFRLEKIARKIQIVPQPLYFYFDCDSTRFWWNDDSGNITVVDGANWGSTTVTNCNVSCSGSMAEDGATIGGNYSDQSFTYSNINVEDEVTVVELKMRGI